MVPAHGCGYALASIFYEGFHSLVIIEHRGPLRRRDSFTHTNNQLDHSESLPLITCFSASHSHCYVVHHASSLVSSPWAPCQRVSRKAHLHRIKPSIHSH